MAMSEAYAYSLEMEACAIGAMIISSQAADDVLAICRDTDFVSEPHQKISKVIRDRRSWGSEIDLVILRDDLGPSLKSAGGMDYLVQVAEQCPSIAHAKFYAERVRELADMREIERLCRETVKEIRAGNPQKALLIASNMTVGCHTKSSVLTAESVIEQAKRGVGSGPSCFLKGITQAFDAEGFKTGLFHGYCAPPGNGKSTFLCSQAVHSLNEGVKVGIVTLEMSAGDLLSKMTRQQTGLWSELHAERSGEVAFQQYTEWIDRFRGWMESGQIAILDESERGATLMQVEGWITAQAKAGTTLFIVDYVQDIRPDGKNDADYSHHHAVSERMKRLAKHLSVSILGLFQVEYQGQEFKFKGGDAYRRDLATILLKVRKKGKDGAPDQEFVLVEKNRYGKSHIGVEVAFDTHTGRLVQI